MSRRYHRYRRVPNQTWIVPGRLLPSEFLKSALGVGDLKASYLIFCCEALGSEVTQTLSSLPSH